MNDSGDGTGRSTGTAAYRAELAWLTDRVAADVLVEVEGDRITAVTPGVTEPSPDATRLPGLTLPGLANAHSHAFHRALRGRTHTGRGSFWTWREQMYGLAARLTPDSYLALARAVYAEMAMAGITCVGEFHYLHHGPGGTRYDDPNEMGTALIEAAADAGLRITLLDTCYLAGGLGAAGPAAVTRPLRWPAPSCGSATATRGGGRTGWPRSSRPPTPGSAPRSTPSARCRATSCPRSPGGRPAPARRCTSTCPSSGPRTRPAWPPTAVPRPGCSPTPGRWGRLPAPCTPPT